MLNLCNKLGTNFYNNDKKKNAKLQEYNFKLEKYVHISRDEK